MGAGSRTLEAERAESFLEFEMGCNISKIMNAYGDGNGSLTWACFHLGKDNTQKLCDLLGTDRIKERLEREFDVVQLSWDLREDLMNILDDVHPCSA